MTIQNKQGLFFTLYHSMNQSHDCFQTFLKDKTTIQGTNIEALTSYNGFEQVINEPTHILPN